MVLLTRLRRQHRTHRHNQIFWIHARYPFWSVQSIAQTDTWWRGEVSHRRENPDLDKLQAPLPKSEIDAEYQPGLMALEIDEVQGSGGSSRPPQAWALQAAVRRARSDRWK